MPKKLLIIWVAATVLAFGQKPAVQLPTSTQLLDESYAIGSELIPRHRMMLLFSIASAAAPISPPLCRQRSRELFWSTYDLPPDWDRGASQKNALELLTQINATEAFNLMPSMDNPVADIRGIIPEDLRAYLASTLFPKYYFEKPSPSRLDEIRNQARVIAASGAYPYRGVSPILKAIWPTGGPQVEAWWQEINSSFTKGSPIRNSNEEFIALVGDLWEQLTPAAKHSVVQEVVSALLQTPAEPEKALTMTYRAIAETNHGDFVVGQRNYFLLLKFLPKIRDAAPDLLKDLRDKAPVFANVDDLVVKSIREAGIVSKSGGMAQESAAAALLAEQRMLADVSRLAANDPSKAISVAAQLSHYSESAFSKISTVVAKATPEEAAEVFRSAGESLAGTSDKAVRLRLLVLQAESGRVAGESSFEAAMKRGFDLGESMFEEYAQTHPAIEPIEVPAYDSLEKLTAIGMRVSPWNTLDRIRHMSDRPLEAYLLIAAAEAIANR